MGSGIHESGLYRTERFGFEVRTSDPATTQPGEGWIRSDIAPDTDQIATLRFDNGMGEWDVPVYDSAATVENVEKVLRIPIGGTVGFVPITTESPTYPQLGVQHNGTQHGVHDALSASPIPGDAINHYDASELTSGTLSTFLDEKGDLDLSASDDPQVIENAKNGNSVVEYDSNDRHTATRSSSINSPLTKIIVIQRTADVDNNFISGGTNPEGNASNYIGVRDTTDVWFAGSSPDGEISGGSTDQQYHILIAIFDGANSEFWIDGSQLATGDTGTVTDDSMLISGPNTIGDFRLGEATVCGANLSTTGELQDEFDRLADKWDITLA